MRSTDRIARLERQCEFDYAHAELDRILAWARAAGHLDEAGEQQARANMAALAGSRENFIAGRWSPPPPADPVTPNAAVCPVNFLAYVASWEATDS